MVIPYTQESVRLTGRWARLPDRAVTTAPGAYIECAFEGDMAVLRFDVTRNVPVVPHLWISVDGGDRTEVMLDRYLRIRTSRPGRHTVQVIFKSASEESARWREPLTGAVQFLGVQTDCPTALAPDTRQLMEFIGYFTAVVWPAMAVSELIEMHSRGKASLARIGKLLDTEPDVKDAPDVAPIPEPVRGEITFSHLTFRYPGGEHDVLHDITLTIRAGERVGLVGKTGSGKTTLVDLLLRTYNVPDGTLFIDDHDVNTVSIHSVREGCAYVPQDNFLFSDTISGNISFAFDDENQEAVEDAAMMSDVHDNIAEFKEGYRTVLGERGVTVSGGQKQRISIARALMKHAPILILDDSVSAVDTKTERTILDNLKKREGLTTILIAHRISTVEQMDKIVFVEDGEVHAVGKHEDLYRTCTAYRKMVDLQKLEEEAGEE